MLSFNVLVCLSICDVNSEECIILLFSLHRVTYGTRLACNVARATYDVETVKSNFMLSMQRDSKLKLGQ